MFLHLAGLFSLLLLAIYCTLQKKKKDNFIFHEKISRYSFAYWLLDLIPDFGIVFYSGNAVEQLTQTSIDSYSVLFASQCFCISSGLNRVLFFLPDFISTLPEQKKNCSIIFFRNCSFDRLCPGHNIYSVHFIRYKFSFDAIS